MRPADLISLSVYKYNTSNLRKQALVKSFLDQIMRRHPVCFAISMFGRREARNFLNELVKQDIVDAETILKDSQCTDIQFIEKNK